MLRPRYHIFADRMRRLSIAALLLLSGCASLPDLLAPPRLELSPAEEQRLGRMALPLALQQLGGPYADAELQAYVERLGRRLAVASDRSGLSWHFVIADRSVASLHLLPGGQVVVSRGLLEGVNDPGELAALLAHAVAHAEDGPLAGPPTTAMVSAARATLAEPDPLRPAPNRPVDRLVEALLERRYAPESEQAADLQADRILARAGIPTAGAAVWQRFCRGPVDGGYGALAATHPCDPARLSPLAGRRDALTSAGLDTTFTRLTAQLRASRPGYALFDQARHREADAQSAAAIGLYLQAAAAAPDQAAILAGLGFAYLRAGDLHAARRHLARAVAIQPDNYRTLMGLGYLSLQQQRADDALDLLQRSVALWPLTENLLLLAQAHDALGNAARAIPLYREVVGADRFGKFGRAAAARLEALEQ